MQKEFQYQDSRVKTIDFRSISCSAPKTAYLDVIVEQLKADGFYVKERLEGEVPVQGLLYRGCNFKRVPALRATGSDTTNDLCCVVESQFRKALEEGDKKGNPFSYAGEYAREKKDKPLLVVFDSSKMRYNGGYVWELPKENPASAIVAIYVLKNLDNPGKEKRKEITPAQGRIIVKNIDLDRYFYEARLRRKRKIHANPKQLELF